MSTIKPKRVKDVLSTHLQTNLSLGTLQPFSGAVLGILGTLKNSGATLRIPIFWDDVRHHATVVSLQPVRQSNLSDMTTRKMLSCDIR